jgi:hypothetical protein
MSWLFIGVVVWVVMALLAALVLGRSIRRAEVDSDADEARALVELETQELTTGTAVSEPPAPAEPELPFTGPDTRPFPPPPSVPRRRAHVLPNHVPQVRQDRSERDQGVL